MPDVETAQWQSGANLTGFSGGGAGSNANFNLNLNSYAIPSTGFVASNVSLLGTRSSCAACQRLALRQKFSMVQILLFRLAPRIAR
jgi:hypothetical protein